MSRDELWKMTAVEAVTRLQKKEISPLDLVEASAQRMAEVEPSVNAMPTLCLDRARDHARRVMAGGLMVPSELRPRMRASSMRLTPLWSSGMLR